MNVCVPPFRTIAIVGDERAALRMFGVGERVAPIPVGVMVRDAEHDAERVRYVAGRLSSVSPSNVHVITNAVQVHDVRFVHLPFEMRAALKSPRDTGHCFGVSVHSRHEAESIGSDFDYAIVSPILPTQSKPGHCGIGLEMLSELCSSIDRPVFALGGLDRRTAIDCLVAGAFGIAGISAFDNDDEAEAIIRVVAQTTHRRQHET